MQERILLSCLDSLLFLRGVLVSGPCCRKAMGFASHESQNQLHPYVWFTACSPDFFGVYLKVGYWWGYNKIWIHPEIILVGYSWYWDIPHITARDVSRYWWGIWWLSTWFGDSEPFLRGHGVHPDIPSEYPQKDPPWYVKPLVPLWKC